MRILRWSPPSPRLRWASVVVALGFVLQGCGGSSGGGSNTPPTPPPGTGNSQNPCSTASANAAILAEPTLRSEEKRRAVDGNSRSRVIDSLSLHREAAQWRERAGGVASLDSTPKNNIDIGEIAVLQDEGDLVAPANAYDLRGLGLRFTSNGAGGYQVSRISLAFRTTLGKQLTLEDDDSESANVAFSFNFYGTPRTTAFVNSDGNVTFNAPDFASTERNVGRLTTGPPRVAPFLADLDPTAGGRIYVNAASDHYTVTWCNVRGFDSTQTITTQVTLLPNGNIEMHYINATGLTDAVVGISPGSTAEFRSVNLSDPGPNDGGPSSVGERFATSAQLDTVAVTKKFYATHPDAFDQLVIWTDAKLIVDAFAFEQTVANEISGIGIPIFDASQEFGSAGRLRSMAVMDFLGKYPDNPQQTFLGENNTVSVLGQEVGHRWLAFMEFRDHTGAQSSNILGRDDSHWSFFFDSDASVMEGNDIEALGGGAFRTVAAVRRYSLFDQYAMGLVAPNEVPPSFYVDNPTNMSSQRTRESAPQIGITFNGTRRDVLIQDVIAVLGDRHPTAAESPRVHRQAFIYVVGAGRVPESAHVTKLDGIRLAWEAFFLQATDGRMRAVTTLR
jgi:hypothetical protein